MLKKYHSSRVLQAEMLIKQPVTNHDEALSAAHRLMEKGCKKHVLITLGKNGALLLSRDDNNSFLEPVFAKAPEVKAIDTTVFFNQTNE